MRKTIDQLWNETYEEDTDMPQPSPAFELLTQHSGEQVRGGDRPFEPMIYESQTQHNRLSTSIFFGKLCF